MSQSTSLDLLVRLQLAPGVREDWAFVYLKKIGNFRSFLFHIIN